MTLHTLSLPLLGSLLLAACIAKEPEPLGNVDSGDDESETDSSTDGDEDGSTTGDSATSSGDDGEDTGAPVCGPDQGYYEPAACPGAGPVIQLPSSGCYEGCAGPGAPCGVGQCTHVQINPCVCPDSEDCCAACGSEDWLCVEGVGDAICDEIVGTTFQSVELLECGLGPEGPELCNWTIEFGVDGSFMWMYSDIGEGHDYVCSDGMITLLRGPVYAHDYDPNTDILTWDGVDYEPVP